MTRAEIFRTTGRLRGPCPPPLWVRALCERTIAQVAARLGIDPGSVMDTAAQARVAVQARKEVARRMYEAFPHQAILARALGVPREYVRFWLRERLAA